MKIYELFFSVLTALWTLWFASPWRQPRAFLAICVIEASEDGERWRELWRGTSAGRAVISSFDVRGSVPMSYRFEPAQVRVIRLRLTAGDDIYYWSIAELRVLGP